MTAAQTAAAAEAAVLARSVRPLWHLPGTALGVVGDPPVAAEKHFLRWSHWWQSHLLDLLLDAQGRSPSPQRERLLRRQYRTILLRTPGLLNSYHDDLAWFALAVQRHGSLPGGDRVVRRIGLRLLQARHPATGGVRWRAGDDFVNTPATGPAAILLARAGAVTAARDLVDWIHRRLTLPSGLIADGLRPTGREDTVFTYNQGVVIGAELELVRRGDAPGRLHTLVAATAQHLAADGVLVGHGGGDGALFTGILARYLALVAAELPGDSAADRRTRELSTALVLRTAQGLVAGAGNDPAGRPLYSPDPATALQPPGPRLRAGRLGRPSDPAVSDLSTQLGAWMVLEAAARLDRPTVVR